MTNEIQYNHTNDTDILYAILRNPAKQIRDVENNEWDTHPESGSLDDCDISAGTASGGLWSGDFPSGIDNGFYVVQIRLRAGSTPDCSDEIIGSAKGFWDGVTFGNALDAKLDKATKLLVNKAVQNKNTGVIEYFDDDGETVILTHTPTDGESTITRTPS